MPDFHPAPDFDGDFRLGGRCSGCHCGKMPDDAFVLRGPAIHLEGFFGLCLTCLRELSREHLQTVPAEEHAAVVSHARHLEAEMAVRDQMLSDAKHRVEQLILQNAELITERDRLQAFYDESFFDEDDEEAEAVA